jgi:asparagine synthase (glutamine-hydrolysing)
MCGIAGRVNRERHKPLDVEVLRRATRTMAHRGPDGEGYYVSSNVGLGHRRLSIVDRAGGAQPMANEDGSVWVVFNGEIYNHLALREELKALGHVFLTRSDTEVLVHGYEAWGDGLPKRLRGMFVFALWDVPRERLFVARDRLGIKPLYWARAGEDLVFASEVKALFAFSEVEARVDEARVPEYLALRYVPGPGTLFLGIEALQPGHSLVFERGVLRVQPFWDVPLHGLDDASWSEAEEADKFLGLFEEAVRMRLMGEVPVGVFLSGGIDSTSVAWAVMQGRPKGFKSFAVGYESDSEGELGYARMAAKAFGLEHREVLVRPEDVLCQMEQLVWHLDEPLSDGACIPLMMLAKRAREEVVVVLSGEGADEVLGGYGIYQRMLAMEQLFRVGGAPARGLLRLGLSLTSHPKLRKYLHLAQQPLERRYLGVGRAFGDELITECFGPSVREEVTRALAPHWARSLGAPALHRMMYNDTKVWLADDLLAKADKMTMAFSIELRVPFLDHVLLESAWRLPPSMKVRGRTGKHLLRRAMRGKLPKPILVRPKKGFPVPLGKWLRTSLYDACREQLLGTSSSVKPFIGEKLLERLLEEHRQGRVDRTEELYALWVFDAWHHRFFRRREALRPANSVREPLGSTLRGASEDRDAARERGVVREAPPGGA